MNFFSFHCYKPFITPLGILLISIGFGSSVAAALFADIARVTSEEERTAVFSVFMMARQFGLMVGEQI